MKTGKLDMSEWIRHRAATGQALNLHEVARVRPDLIAEAFALPSPQGWRRCLMDAGVDPLGIVHNHEEHVECAICGLSFGVLGTHLQHRHQMTGEDYHREYGEYHDLTSEAYRADKFRGRPISGIDHWERLWSKYYIIDWVLRLHEEGHRLNMQNMSMVANPVRTIGYMLFGSWDATLLAAGFNPAEERAIPVAQRWTKGKLFAELRGFAKLKHGKSRLEMPDDLRQAARRWFGSLEEAARAAGLVPEDVCRQGFFTNDKVDALVSELRTLENLKGRVRRAELARIYQHNVKNKNMVLGCFGSLKRLAKACGINARAVSTESYRDEADVHHDLDILEREGKPLGFRTLKSGYKRLYNVIRETGWGAGRLDSEGKR